MSETFESNAKYPDEKHAFPSRETADRLARLVTELGVGWAKYGLTAGRLALRQSAKALETTSEILGTLAERVEKLANAESAQPAEGEIVTTAEDVKS